MGNVMKTNKLLMNNLKMFVGGCAVLVGGIIHKAFLCLVRLMETDHAMMPRNLEARDENPIP